MERWKKHQILASYTQIFIVLLCVKSQVTIFGAQSFLSLEMHLLRVPTLGKTVLRRFLPGGAEPKYHLCF